MEPAALIGIIFWVVIFLITVVLHELCHGLAAYALGDPTAKEAGRLTLNPLRHIDPFWTLLLPGFLFFSTGGRFAIGMAKPVPVNFLRLRRPKQDMIWVAFAGPSANIALAWVLTLVLRLTGLEFLLYAIYFNLGLAVFNLIPIPPLDGSKILAGLLPMKVSLALLRLEPFGFPLILFLYFTGLLFYLVVPGMDFFCRALGIPPVGVHF